MLSMKSASPISASSPGFLDALWPWLLAFRPKTLVAAVVPVSVATAVVVHHGHGVHQLVVFCALIGAMSIQVATNLFNDAIDFHKGADNGERLGPRRVTQSGLLSSRSVFVGGLFFLGIAMLCGIPLVMAGGWPLVVIGLVSMAMAYAYTGGPWPLAYLGLGDLFVVLFFGLIAVVTTYFLQTGETSPDAWVAGLQVGFLATVLIAINNLRDTDGDRKVDKKTLAVRFGKNFVRWEILLLMFLSFGLGAYWYLSSRVLVAFLPLLTLPLAISIARGVFRNEPSPLYNQFLAKAAGLQVAFCALLILALVWVR